MSVNVNKVDDDVIDGRVWTLKELQNDENFITDGEECPKCNKLLKCVYKRVDKKNVHVGYKCLGCGYKINN